MNKGQTACPVDLSLIKSNHYYMNNQEEQKNLELEEENPGTPWRS